MANKKILIAEDEVALAKTLEFKLTKSGYDVTLAADGDQALNHLDSEKYDLLLLDLMMPIKTGWDVLEELKQKNNKQKTVVTTNLSQEEDKQKALGLGAADYIVKSDTTLEEIVAKISGLLQ